MTIWRLGYFVITIFWIAMTSLLIKRIYFPADDGFQPVPLEMLFSRFSQHHDVINNLSLLRDDLKLGHASVSAKEWLTEDSGTVRGYAIHAGGMVEGELWEQPGFNMSWSFTGRFDLAQVWHSIDLRLRSPESSVMWEKGQELPKIEVMREGVMVMDTPSLMAQAKMASALPGLADLPFLQNGKLDATLSAETALQMNVRQGVSTLAGQRRKSFQMQLKLLELLEATAHFTEAGELARVDLPQNLRLLDPIIFGLENEAPPAGNP
jgi:hypothetical protein